METKPLAEQAIVITGATSGIGLATARLAIARGARVVANGRTAEALEQLEHQLDPRGAQAACVAGDVANRADVQRIVEVARERFGGFDTWVNNAGVSAYGRLEELSDEDGRRIFETNFWGTVYGSLAAARHLRQRGGGTIINVGSTVSDRAIPLQGMYSASKHAIKGFTDALRMELEHDGAPIAVTLVKPGSIDTPYTEHAKNYLDSFPSFPPPVYAPEVVARAILRAAEHPVRDVFVGAGGKALSMLGNLMPRTMDRIMEQGLFSAQRSGRPPHGREGLHEPAGGLSERGEYESQDGGHVARTSLYTQATLHPWLTAAAVAGTVAAARLLRARGLPLR